MILRRKPKCMQSKGSYTFDYPVMLDFEQKQMENFWLPNEPKIEKDLHMLKTGLTPQEYHGVLTVLKLFTLYEVAAGEDYWNGRFKRMFKRHEFRRAAAVNGMTELNIHAPFYNKANELLNLNTDEFYTSYVNDPVLKQRMDFIEDMITSEDDLLSLAGFSMLEGAVLYSSFSYLKHFQVNGKNKLGGLVAGMDFSVRDENIHSLCGATAFQIAIKECLEEGIITESELSELRESIYDMARTLTKHEFRIIDMIFEKGEITGITSDEMKTFVMSRVNVCLNNLGLDAIWEVGDNPIARWFYSNINMPTIHDFFVNLGSQYNRNWSESAFLVPKNKYKFTG